MTVPVIGYTPGIQRVVIVDPTDTRRSGEIDSLFSAPLSIDIAHHEVHEGAMFSAFISDASAADTEQIQVMITTPNTTELAHVVWEHYSSGQATVTLKSGITYSAGGSAFTPINRNRGSSHTSACTVKTGSDGGADLITYTGGTTAWSAIYGSGRLQGGSSRETSEWILAPNTTNIIEVTSNTTSLIISLGVIWYEHASE